MKKVISILLCIVSVVGALFTYQLNWYQNSNALSDIECRGDYQKIYVTGRKEKLKEVLPSLKQVADTYDANIIYTTYREEKGKLKQVFMMIPTFLLCSLLC